MQGLFGNRGGAGASEQPTNSNSGQNANNGRAGPDERVRQALGGVRARSTTFRTANGNTMSVINIGVPSDHPFANGTSHAGPSGLHNIRVGGIDMPAPQFVVLHRNNGEENSQGGGAPSNNNNNNNTGNGPSAESNAEGSRVGDQIENLVNDLLRSFMNVFDGREFLRMQMQYNDFNPNNFMQNFNSNFASDDLFEMIRRMSE